MMSGPYKRPHPSEIASEHSQIGRTDQYQSLYYPGRPCYDSGESMKKKKMMVNAYSTAWDILNPTIADDMLVDHRRVENEEIICTNGTGESTMKKESMVNACSAAQEIPTTSNSDIILKENRCIAHEIRCRKGTWESTMKKESMVNAYSAAQDIPTTSNLDKILKENRCIENEEIWCTKETGESVKEQESMVIEFPTAQDILTTSIADDILKEHICITNDEIGCMDDIMQGTEKEGLLKKHFKRSILKSDKKIQRKYKFKGTEIRSNLAELKTFGHNTVELKKKMEDLVIIEHFYWARDRSSHSFCILHFSCLQNGIYMQWETKQFTAPSLFKLLSKLKACYENGNIVVLSCMWEDGQTGIKLLSKIREEIPGARCIITIDKMVMGESYGYGKQHARIMAAAVVLYKLYETNTVIRIWPRRDLANEDWIPYEDIMKEAESLKYQSKESYYYENRFPDSFVFNVIDNRLTKYVENNKENVSKLIFGPGFTGRELGHLRRQANLLNLTIECQQKQGKSYFCVYEKLDWDMLGAILKNKEQHWYGRYELVPESELPKWSYIEKSSLKRVITTEEVPKQEQKDQKDTAFVVV